VYAGHETAYEGIVLEFLQEIVHVELQLGVEHLRRTFGHVRVGYELCILQEVVLGQDHHLDGVDLQDDPHLVATHLRIIVG
jgi:hypothetical protein